MNQLVKIQKILLNKCQNLMHQSDLFKINNLSAERIIKDCLQYMRSKGSKQQKIRDYSVEELSGAGSIMDRSTAAIESAHLKKRLVHQTQSTTTAKQIISPPLMNISINRPADFLLGQSKGHSHGN